MSSFHLQTADFSARWDLQFSVYDRKSEGVGRHLLCASI